MISSCGYHGDDGGVFIECFTHAKLLWERYSSGTTIGCGVYMPLRKVFYTRNGQFVGMKKMEDG